jgi:hypothetical protein
VRVRVCGRDGRWCRRAMSRTGAAWRCWPSTWTRTTPSAPSMPRRRTSPVPCSLHTQQSQPTVAHAHQHTTRLDTTRPTTRPTTRASVGWAKQTGLVMIKPDNLERPSSLPGTSPPHNPREERDLTGTGSTRAHHRPVRHHRPAAHRRARLLYEVPLCVRCVRCVRCGG